MKNKKKLRNIIIILISLIVVFLIVGKQAGWLGKENATKVSIEKAELRDITEYVSASGKIQPEKEIIIAPDASGEIVGLLVKEGDSVKAGDLLMKINPDIYISAVERMEATLNSSKANLANAKARKSQTEAQLIKAKADYQRNKTLFDQKVISQAEFDGVLSAFEVAKAEVKAAEESIAAAQYSVKNAEASLKEARDNLTKTAVFAPIDGTVSKLVKELGERVAGASQFSGGTEVMRLANLAHMEAQVDVSENDIVRVKLGDTALIEVDAYLEKKFKGIVTQIANSSTTDVTNTDQVTNFKVRIRILPSSYQELMEKLPGNISPFRPGMSASVEILTNYRNNVVSLPIQAVTTRENPNKNEKDTVEHNKSSNKAENITDLEETKNEYVFVLDGDMAVLREVKTGIQDDRYFEILEGIKEGEEVITAPYRAISKTLKDKEKVKVVKKSQLFGE